jgi:glycine/D-amino acid oxidase-like deaminating enzyme/nitrite reductase/ring-hydroxylating ferredoxin subunit
MNTEPYWTETAALPRFESLSSDLKVDVVIIGGGLTGITAAHLLKAGGATVALLERGRCGGADTGHTTAHLTYVTDERLNQLVKFFGADAARAFWEAGAAAIDQIHQLVRDHEIDCDFKWVPGFLHGRLDGDSKDEREGLMQDAELARKFGFDATFMEAAPPAGRPGVQFANQAKFHPLKYLAPLLEQIPGNGSHVLENTEASEIEADPLTIHAGQYKIQCQYLIIATHTPLMGNSSLVSATLFQTKLALYTSYVLGAVVPRGLLPEALFWDTSDPYYYMRVDRGADQDYCIFGGNDVKTGQEDDAVKVLQQLEDKFRKLLPEAKVRNRWLGQVVETNDGLPFIGENQGKQFIATGFCGNGFTLGTLAAVMACDRYFGRKNPWFDLFAVNRRKFHGGTWRYLEENLDYPYYMVRDRLAKAQGDSLDELGFEEGKILKLNGHKTAAYRDKDGKVSLCSPICTHLKCIVRWNAADRTWDCPCHGSRFKPTGEVHSGPAEAPLEKIPWPEKKD